jgi:hypothetical protein
MTQQNYYISVEDFWESFFIFFSLVEKFPIIILIIETPVKNKATLMVAMSHKTGTVEFISQQR